MNRFLKWLGHKFFGNKPKRPAELYRTGSRISPARPQLHPVPVSKPKAAVPAGSEPASIGGDDEFLVEDGEPAKNVLVRNRFVREDTGTHETLKIFDDSVLETDEVKGFDPYNTGRFDRSKHWDKRTRE